MSNINNRKQLALNGPANPMPREVSPALWADGGAGEPADNLHRLLALVRRRRKTLLAVLLGVVAISALLALLSPTTYEATATLQANTAARGNDTENDLPVLSELMQNNQTRALQTQVAILQGNLIHQRAMSRLSPAMRKAAAGSTTKIEPDGETDLIKVSVTSRNRQAAAALANVICKEYIQLSLEKNREQLHSTAQFVGGQLKRVGDRLNHARAAMKRYKVQQGTFDLAKESDNLITQIGDIESEWRQARAAKEASWAQLNTLRGTIAGMAPTQVTSSTITPTPAVDAMKTQLTKLELDRMAAIQEYRRDSPEVRDLEGQIAAIRRRLRSQAQTEISSRQVQPNAARLAVVQEIARLKGESWAQEARGIALKAAWKQAKAELARLPGREQRLSQMTTELATLQQSYQMLNEKYQTLRMSEGARVANASLLFLADVPKSAAGPKRGRLLLMGVLAGLLLAACFGALVDWLDDRVYSDEDAELASGLPVLSHVPLIEAEAQRCLIAQSDGTQAGGDQAAAPSLLLESNQMLRTNIAFSAVGRPVRSVVLTSSLPNEGKSLSSANLAAAAALSGERVILVDCDLRRPSLHRLCDLPNEVGLSDVVAGSRSLDDALQQTKIPGLRVLTSGALPPNPLKLLKSEAADVCLQQIVEQADFVVIDAPPALVWADAQVIATKVDAILMVISCKASRRREIARVCNLLARTETEMIGTLLNKLTAEAGSYYSYHLYQQYSGDIQPENSHKKDWKSLIAANGKPPTPVR